MWQFSNYSRTRIYQIVADCEIYPIYSKSDIYNRNFYCFVIWGPKILFDISDYPIYPSSIVVCPIASELGQQKKHVFLTPTKQLSDTYYSTSQFNASFLIFYEFGGEIQPLSFLSWSHFRNKCAYKRFSFIRVSYIRVRMYNYSMEVVCVQRIQTTHNGRACAALDFREISGELT